MRRDQTETVSEPPAQPTLGLQESADAAIFRSKLAVRTSRQRIDESHRTMDRLPHREHHPTVPDVPTSRPDDVEE